MFTMPYLRKIEITIDIKGNLGHFYGMITFYLAGDIFADILNIFPMNIVKFELQRTIFKYQIHPNDNIKHKAMSYLTLWMEQVYTLLIGKKIKLVKIKILFQHSEKLFCVLD